MAPATRRSQGFRERWRNLRNLCGRSFFVLENFVGYFAYVMGNFIGIPCFIKNLEKIKKTACILETIMLQYNADAPVRACTVAPKTADFNAIFYGRRISSESKIICKTDLREMQGH